MEENQNISDPQEQYEMGLKYLALSRKRISSQSDTRKFLNQCEQQDAWYLEAIEWLRKASEQKYAPAQNALGWQYEIGIAWIRLNDSEIFGVNGKKKALDLYRSAAQSGYAPAQKHLGVMLFSCKEIKRNSAQGLQWLQKAVNQGDIDAMFFLGGAYQNWLKPKNDKKAIFWYKKAADKNHSYAQAKLAAMYHKGEGVRRNYEKALMLYRKAAVKNVPQSIQGIGEILCLRKEYTQARAWYRKLTVKGVCGDEVIAMLKLGEMYEYGIGTKKSRSKAIEWYQKACMQSASLYPHLIIKAQEAITRLENNPS